jgi:CheY-like chemotaxis protein
LRILIAEDEPLDRELLTAYLTTWGHEVLSCEDGNRAWKELERPNCPRLLLLDWVMPGIDGVELCRRLRQRADTEQIYIILVTGKSRKQDIVTGLEAGANDYVVKPFDQEELGARVKVGVRVVELWEKLLETERLRVLVQTAGAAAHEINQPLSVILGLSQLLQRTPNLDENQQKKLKGIGDGVKKISGIVQRMSEVEQYSTRAYVENIDIVDFGADKETTECGER